MAWRVQWLAKPPRINQPGREQMNATRIVGIVLIIAGVLGLVYGGFGYDKETTKAKIGPLELKVQEHETVNVPVVVSATGLVLGVVLVLIGGKK
jgi:hypothetical protein